LSVEENLIIKGTSAPENNIKIYILKEGMEPITGETKADKDGKWTYIYDKLLTKGVYKVSAVTINSKKAQSYPSESVVILVTLPAIFKIGSVIINYLTAIIALIGFIALMIFGAYWSWHRFTLFRKKLIKETQDVDRVMKQSFDLLKEDVKDQLAKLNKVKNNRELNEKEKEIESQLKKDIDIAEKYIRREVEDVEKKLTSGKFNIKNLFKRNKKK
jgi:F0F1-type ATP synthase membrane subunit b/b'